MKGSAVRSALLLTVPVIAAPGSVQLMAAENGQ
jgi:hypothetical protein